MMRDVRAIRTPGSVVTSPHALQIQSENQNQRPLASHLSGASFYAGTESLHTQPPQLQLKFAAPTNVLDAHLV